MLPPSDLSLEAALGALISHLTAPLDGVCSAPAAARLRQALVRSLSTLYRPTWHEQDPSRGSAFRSLIALSDGRLPRPMREAATAAGVDQAKWARTLAPASGATTTTEWQCWCDPGRVSWRDGGWEWEDGVFYLGGWKDTIRVVWAAPSLVSSLPRASHALAIRAPTSAPAALPAPTPVFTSSTVETLSPLSDGRPDSPSGSDISSSTFTSHSAASATSSHPVIVLSSASVSSNASDRSRSVSPPAKKHSVTAYDGGKVGVLGGGVKLGGPPPSAATPSPPKKLFPRAPYSGLHQQHHRHQPAALAAMQQALGVSQAGQGVVDPRGVASRPRMVSGGNRHHQSGPYGAHYVQQGQPPLVGAYGGYLG